MSTAVLGIRTKEQLNDALLAANAAPLTAEEVKRMQAALPANRYAEHR
jgi:aryl-alcohol dehydrogenase-like predicted oxidoreductase